MKGEFPDTLTHSGATRLQRAIENNWYRQGILERGFKTWLEQLPTPEGQKQMFAVRSNMTFDSHGWPILKPRTTAPLLDSYPE